MADLNTWATIREGANEVEKLIGQKQYNAAMIKSRQTLEYMVRVLSSHYGIKNEDLASMIRSLYKKQIISGTSAEHYDRIRIIGDKAKQEGYDAPSGANESYHLLSQELYTFANEFANNASKSKGSSQGNDDSVARAAHRSSKKSGVSAELIFKIMIPVLLIVLVIGIFKLISSEKEKEQETEPEYQTVVETTAAYVPETIIEPETEPETLPVYVVNCDALNVREEPNTDCAKLGKMTRGETLEYIEDVDDKWIMINYNGTEGFVSKDFIMLAEPEGQEAVEGEEPSQE